MQEYAKMKDILKSFIAIFVAGSALATWEPLNSGSSDNLFGISFYDSENGIAAGWGVNNGVVLKTSDGGDNWSQQIPLAGAYLFGVNYKSQDEIFIAGSDAGGSFTGLVLRSQNAGESWTWTTHGASWGFYVADFPSASTGYTCGYQGAVYRTQNGGENWQLRGTNTQMIFRSMHFPTEQTGYAVGGTDFLSPNTIYKTSNSAEDWQMRYSFGNSLTIGGVHFLNENEGVIVGGAGHESIQRSNDGGASWSEVHAGPNGVVLQALWMEENEGWAVGNSGRVLHSVDGGFSWDLENDGMPQSAGLLNICRGGDWVYASGSGGILYRHFTPQTVPNLGVDSFQIISDDNGDARPDPGETVELELRLENSSASIWASNINISMQFADDGLTIINENLSYPDAGPGEIVSSQDRFSFLVDHTIEPFYAVLTFTITADYEGGSLELIHEERIRIGRPDVLVVDSDGGQYPNELFLTDQLESRDINFDLLRALNEPVEGEEIQRYQRIFWLGGINEDDIRPNEVEALALFLDNGGQLLLSSQYATERESNQDFLAEYFGITLVDNDIGTEFVALCDVPENNFTDAAFVLSGSSGANNLEEPDAIDGIEVFGHWMSGGLGAATMVQGENYRAVFCGFPVEAMRIHGSVDGSMDMSMFLDRLELYFSGSAVSEFSNHLEPESKLISAFPNPFNPYTNLSIELVRVAEVGVELYNSLGQLIKQVNYGTLGAGQHRLQIKADNLGSGSYYMCLNLNGERISSRKVILIK
jgi:photosystem II stability/assembly factor-like uncharacterized protein